MNSPATLTASAALRTTGGYAGALHAASRRVTWRVVAATLAIAAALEVWSVYEFVFDSLGPSLGTQIPAVRFYISAAIINLLMAFAIMFTTFVADEMVARGAKRLLAYAWAVITGSAVAALAQWELHQWLHLPTRYDGPGVPHEVTIMQPAGVFFEYLIWGSIAVFIYVNRRTSLMAMARMNAAQVEQARTRRRTLESRLQALQARVEPQFLFNTLAQVRNLYECDSTKGARMLDELIVYLRAALPHLRETTSTLGREMELASAYLGIMRMHLGERLAFDADIAPTALAARLPSMMVLPLIDHVLACGLARSAAGGTIRIAARTNRGRLQIEITARGNDMTPGNAVGVLHDIHDRLSALYGDRAALRVAPLSDNGSKVIMEIPHESADGDHR
jgi:hypothetical protein